MSHEMCATQFELRHKLRHKNRPCDFNNLGRVVPLCYSFFSKSNRDKNNTETVTHRDPHELGKILGKFGENLRHSSTAAQACASFLFLKTI